MFNPFISQPYIDSVDALLGRNEQHRELRRFFRDRNNAVLFGPEGSGKSALLRCFFNSEFRRKMARKQTLIYVGEFPKNLDGEGTYGYFADAIRTSVDILEFCDMADRRDAILRSMDAVSYDTKQSRFAQYLNKVQGFGFRMVFILDNFENFTSSPDVKPEHHDLLCGMLNDDKLQLIVASNFDFNETSLPAGTRNSQLLTRLSPNSIHMAPLSPEDCQALLDWVAEEEDEDFRFTPQQVRDLHDISGGIPLLLYMAAKHAFTVLEEGTEPFAPAVLERALPEALPILKHWCKVTPRNQLDLLSALREGTALREQDKTDAGALVERGLLRKAFDLGRDGSHIPAEGYTYNSGLFREFCGNSAWLDAVWDKNPLRKEPAPAPAFDPSAILNGSGGPVYIGQVTVHQGDVIDNRGQQNLTYQPTVVAAPGFARLFDMLDLSGDALGGRLLELFNGTPRALPETVDADLVAEETADRIASMFIPQEIEEGKLEECQEEQKTLEDRFNAIRSKVDPEGYVDDALLESLSLKCRMYLQIAFVVDDVLSPLKNLLLGDLSAQMVMYGKVLEQQLKDNLYPLFNKDEVLRDIDVFKNTTDVWSKTTFGFMKLHKTSIGNYMALMQGQSQRLETLCAQKQVTDGDQPLDALWWENLGSDVNDARNLRNGGDHAGTETAQDDLEGMRRLLFGQGRILHRCGAGKRLTQAIWPPKPKAVPAAKPLDEDKAALQGQTVDMTNIQVTGRGGIRGTIVGTDYSAAVSPKHLQERGCDPQDLVGKTVSVKIIRWDANPTSQKFNAELA